MAYLATLPPYLLWLVLEGSNAPICLSINCRHPFSHLSVQLHDALYILLAYFRG